MPLLKQNGSKSNKNVGTSCGGGVSRRNTKPFEVLKIREVTTPRSGPNQSLGATFLDRTRMSIKDNTATKISNLSSGKQIHGKMRNVKTLGIEKEEVERVSRLGNRKGCTISSKNKLKRAKR
jgi:hypothetical protein